MMYRVGILRRRHADGGCWCDFVSRAFGRLRSWRRGLRLFYVMLLPSSTFLVGQRPTRITIGPSLATVPGLGSGKSLGRVEDVEIDRRGRVYVLDSEHNTLEVFDAKGRFLSVAGGPGRAAGKLFMPKAIALDGADGVYVVDAGNAQVLRFKASSGKVSFETSFAVPVDIADICVSRGRVVIFGMEQESSNGPYQGAVLRVFDRTGEQRTTFGIPFGSKSRAVQEVYAQGHVLCTGDANLILVLPYLLPEVRAYDFKGRLRWRSTLPNYLPASVLQNADGSVTLSRPGSGYHRATGLRQVSSTIALAVLEFRATRPDGTLGKVSVESRFISLLDGHQVGSQELEGPLLAMNDRVAIMAGRRSPPLLTLKEFTFR